MNNKIFARKNDGTLVSYDLLLTFTSDIDGNNYFVYTDNVVDNGNKLRLYAGIYDPNVAGKYLGEPNTTAQWQEILSVLDRVYLGK